jgi:large subunit ribosomal protein L21
MYAVVSTGGKQLKVEEGTEAVVEKLDAPVGDTVALDVLFVADDGQIVSDAEALAKASVSAEVVEHFLGDKQVVFKFKRRKGYKRLKGHRQQQTRIRVTGIDAAAAKKVAKKATPKPKKAEDKPAAKVEAEVAEAAVAVEETAKKAEAATEKAAKETAEKVEKVPEKVDEKAKEAAETVKDVVEEAAEKVEANVEEKAEAPKKAKADKKADAEPALCAATKADGTPCKNKAKEGSEYCGVHAKKYDK